jgi:hypothetical protein
MKKLRLLILLCCCAATGFACGGKKGEINNGASKGEDDTAGTDSGNTQSDLLPEAETGPVEYPKPPARSAASRNPVKFEVSLKKAYVLPLSEDGSCFDPCTEETKNTMADALPGLVGDQFGSAAKALTTSLGAKGGKDALPDIYVHIDCGFGQEIDTNKTGAENRLAANWRGVSETLKLDAKDSCAVSVWDADDDGQDELIGDTVVELVAAAQDGTVTVSSESNDFGQVFVVELFLEQLEGTPVLDTPSGEGSSGSSGSSGGSSDSSASSGDGSYYVEIVKADIREKKQDGQKWDAKLPFVGKAGDEAPDPFVHAYVNGYQSETPFLKTQAAQNTTSVEWNQGATVKLSASDKIHFMVWDKDTADHDLIGECISASTSSLRTGTEITLKDCGQVASLVFKISRR